MMPWRDRWQTVWTVFRKELLEAIRNRRTLLVAVLVPMLMYPVLLTIVGEVTASHQANLEASTSTIAIAGGDATHPLWVALDADPRVEVVPVEGPDAAPALLVLDVSDWDADALATRNVEVRARYTSVDDIAGVALERTREVVETLRLAEANRRLAAHGLDVEQLRPIALEVEDLAAPEQRGGFLLGALIPFFVLFTLSTGVLAPAVDATAGERERRTLQTLFTAPISPADVAMGKCLAVVLLGLLTGAANLLSMALFLGSNSMVGNMLGDDVSFGLTPGMLLGMGVLLVALAVFVAALAVFVAALFLVLATLGRDQREAQTWVTPAYLLCILPAMIAQMPGFELSRGVMLVPIIGAVLLMKSLLVEGLSWAPLIGVTAAHFAWAWLLLRVAGWLLGHDSVLTGHSLSVRGWWRRPAKPRDVPPSSEAMLLWGIGFVLLFYVGAGLQAAQPQLGLVVTLWGIVLGLPLFWVFYGRLDWRRTLALRMPQARWLVAATLLGAGCWVVLGGLQSWLASQGLGAPPEIMAEMERQMQAFFPPPQTAGQWISLLLLAAVSPAICEEVFFRGFLLTGLRQSMRPWLAVALSALLFGIFHMSLWRLFGTTALGLVMGALVVRSGSLLPAVIFHALNNGLAVTWSSRPDAADDTTTPGWLIGGAVACVVSGLAVLFWPSGSQGSVGSQENAGSQGKADSPRTSDRARG